MKKAFLGMAQKPETTMKNRGKTGKPKNVKLLIAKKTPWTNMQGHLIQSIKIWNANYHSILFLGTNLEISTQTSGHRYMYEDI